MKRIAVLLALAAGVAAGWVLARKLLERESEEVRPAGGVAPGPGAEEFGPSGASSMNGPVDLSQASKAELYEQAKRLQIEGRSKMSKAELARAVGQARRG